MKALHDWEVRHDVGFPPSSETPRDQRMMELRDVIALCARDLADVKSTPVGGVWHCLVLTGPGKAKMVAKLELELERAHRDFYEYATTTTNQSFHRAEIWSWPQVA